MSMVGIAFIAFFSYINLVVWGDYGEVVHLLGIPIPAYTLVWLWVAMIALIIGVNNCTIKDQKHSIWLIISAWWAANIGVTSILNTFGFRAIEQSNGLIAGYPDIMTDFIAQGTLDITALVLMYLAVRKGYIVASLLLVIFGGFLVANLFGHAFGAYGLVVGSNVDEIAYSYDSYMYLVFTVLLMIQVGGAVLDLIVKLIGAGYNVYGDIRPYFDNVIHKHIHF